MRKQISASIALLFLVVLNLYDVGNQLTLKLESDPLMVINQNIAETYTVPRGGSFIFERTVCTTKSLAVTVHREFDSTDSVKIYMLHSVGYVPSKGCAQVQFETQVPSRVPPGNYLYKPTLSYRINKEIDITKPAPPVKIVVE